MKAHGGSLRHVYRYALKGFAVASLPDAAVEALQRNPRVERVERDGIVTINGTQTPAPSWGLDRIDARTGPDASYTYPNDGTGVTAYILDTGINSGARISRGASARAPISSTPIRLTTATATARTSPARWAARSTAWRRR